MARGGQIGQTYNRGAHHRVTPASRPRTRAAEVAAAVEAAGASGIGPAALAEIVGVKACCMDSVLATVTPRYPEVYEDDAGRLYWLGGECEA